MYVVEKILSILLICSFVFTQEPCDGTCFSEDEVINITNNFKLINDSFKMKNFIKILCILFLALDLS